MVAKSSENDVEQAPSTLAGARPEPTNEEAWHLSRSGSRAVRGFDFQHVVGAWLASQIATGKLVTDRLIPEGFADLHLEGADRVRYEVKSRQAKRGPFSASEASGHIADALTKLPSDARLVVVLEKGIKGWDIDSGVYGTEIPLNSLFDEFGEIGKLIQHRIDRGDHSTEVFEELIGNASILVVPWDWLVSETKSEIRSIRELPGAAIAWIARDLQSTIAAAADKNAEVEYQNRFGVDRTMLVNEINSSAELIDLDSIEYALSTGICSAIDLTPSEAGDAYYEGVSTQLGHVGADLVVPRPDLVTEVLKGLEDGKTTLLEGPSGIGKSAVLWTLPLALPGVLWFKVNRVSSDDVSQIVRLLNAHEASPGAPVGILVDGVGNSEMLGWSRLQAALADMPGVHLVGSVRSEDMFVLGDVADFTTVQVSLNEQSAETIYNGLIRRGKTSEAHWREAFEKCNGLTLEFTHLLTQGKRLSDVIADQINKRINEIRVHELEVLARVAVADRWSASVEIEALRQSLGISAWEIRSALGRLNQEHLLIEVDGALKGVHQIRSTAIVDAIHDAPPPKLDSTVLNVLRILHGTSLTRFVFEVVKDRPDLSNLIIGELKQLSDDNAGILEASLRGLELFDFWNQSARWLEIVRRHNVAPAHIPLVYLFAVGDIDPPEISAPEIRESVAEMVAGGMDSDFREALINEIGVPKIASMLVNIREIEHISRLLRSLIRTGTDWHEMVSCVTANSDFLDTLNRSPLSDLADCVALALEVSEELATELVGAVGGTEFVFKKFRSEDPWILELRLVDDDGERVGYARFLHVSDVDQGDPRDRSIKIGQLLLRTLPNITKVDVHAVLPGGHKLEIDGFDHTASGLLRKYDHHPVIARTNQERMCLAHLHFGTCETERLTRFSQLLPKCVGLLEEFGTMFARRDFARSDLTRLEKRRLKLLQEATDIAPGVGPDPLSDEPETQVGDPLSAFILNVCGNALPRFSQPKGYLSLSAFVNQTLIAKDIPAIKREPWWLIGRDCPGAELDGISDLLSDLDAMIIELSSNPDSLAEMSKVAKAGPRIRALTRAAEFSRAKTRRRIEKRRQEVTDAFVSLGLPLQIYWYDGDPSSNELPNFAVAVELQTLADWGPTVEKLLPTVKGCESLGESPLLVPLINGKSVKPLAWRHLNSKLWPGNDSNEFDEQLPPPVEQRLTKLVLAANVALQTYSGLSIISDKVGSRDELESMRLRSKNSYDDAITEIRKLPEDELTKLILEWFDASASSVELEWDNHIEAGTFAANAVGGGLGLNSDHQEQFMGLLMLTLEWDLAPARALQLLAS